jgi:threonine/homoserine/homoserine lactone efflux protein
MPAYHILLAFLVTTTAFAFIPGPAMFYAAARTVAGGRAAGMMAVLGIHLGSYVHIVAASAGLTALFQAVPIAYGAVKLFGAGYLAWLGLSLFKAEKPSEAGLESAPAASALKAFRQSVVVEMLNPKTAIFFLAFLPQFVDAQAPLPVWAQIAILGFAVNLIFTVADLVAVVFAGLILARVKQSAVAQRVFRQVAGAILIALGARLALQNS